MGGTPMRPQIPEVKSQTKPKAVTQQRHGLLGISVQTQNQPDRRRSLHKTHCLHCSTGFCCPPLFVPNLCLTPELSFLYHFSVENQVFHLLASSLFGWEEKILKIQTRILIFPAQLHAALQLLIFKFFESTVFISLKLQIGHYCWGGGGGVDWQLNFHFFTLVCHPLQAFLLSFLWWRQRSLVQCMHVYKHPPPKTLLQSGHCSEGSHPGLQTSWTEQI